jgi:hypothetical protein
MTEISDSNILKIWRDPSFNGSYRGIKTFQILLKTDLNIEVSEKRLYKVLKQDPIYLIHLRPHRHFERRHYDLRFYGELVQADIAYMYDFNGFKYFLLLIDGFSSKIFVEPLKSKDSETVSEAFRKIFDEFKAKIYVLQTDSGSEFFGKSKKLFAEKKIVFRKKRGQNKASIAENGILIIKTKLYKLLRGTLNNNWVKYISNVVNSHNETPMKKLGWLKPNEIHSEFDSVLVQQQKTKFNIPTYKEPLYETQVQNQKSLSAIGKKFQINDFVYLDLDEKLFDKSFDIQVRKLLQKLFQNIAFFHIFSKFF